MIDARTSRFALVLGLLSLALLLIGRLLETDLGLSARYYPRLDWQGNAVARTDREISTRSLNPLPRSVNGRPFSARWEGYLHIDEPGRYVFQLISDDGSWLEIDGRGVIDNGGEHSTVLRQVTLDLTGGNHPISLTFFQGAGGWQLELLWAREGERLRSLAAPWLTGTPIDGWQLSVARTMHAILPYVPFLWLAAGCIALIGIGRPLFQRLHVTECLSDPALLVIVLLSSALNVGSVWWGLDGRWASDEILPSHVLEAIESRFSGGWSGPYPPVQYYVLSLAYLPFLVAGWVLDGAIAWPFHLLNRVVSLLMAAAVLLAWYQTGRTLGGRMAGLAAAALTAVLLPFVYYAKLANLDIPYLFWFSWAMMFYARIISTGDVGAYAWFAGTGALAIASKDQAFGFFVAPAVHVAVIRYRRLLLDGALTIRAWRDAVVPRAALVGIVTLVVAYNLPLNWSGFVDHVEVIRKNASGQYRMVATSFDGQLTLLRYTLSQIRFAFGWPALLLVCAGLSSAMVRPVPSRAALAAAACRVLLRLLHCSHVDCVRQIRHRRVHAAHSHHGLRHRRLDAIPPNPACRHAGRVRGLCVLRRTRHLPQRDDGERLASLRRGMGGARTSARRHHCPSRPGVVFAASRLDVRCRSPGSGRALRRAIRRAECHIRTAVRCRTPPNARSTIGSETAATFPSSCSTGRRRGGHFRGTRCSQTPKRIGSPTWTK